MPNEDIELITGEFVELASTSQQWGGSNDYSRIGTRIVEIVDRDGRSYKIGFSADWQELAAGIMVRREAGEERVRIHRDACPVRVCKQSYREYDSYTDWEHSSHSASEHWVRYEASR